VVNDHDQDALGTEEPMVFFMNRLYPQWIEVNYISIKLSSEDVFKSITDIGQVFEEIYPSDSFNYFFMDDQFNQHYNSIAKFGEVLSIFTFKAIIISNLGLFGLTAFIALQRKRR
jgi:putative ABC transport system permease protein